MRPSKEVLEPRPLHKRSSFEENIGMVYFIIKIILYMVDFNSKIEFFFIYLSKDMLKLKKNAKL